MLSISLTILLFVLSLLFCMSMTSFGIGFSADIVAYVTADVSYVCACYAVVGCVCCGVCRSVGTFAQ